MELWAWAWGALAIDAVHISVDGGQTWQAAAVEPREQRSWQRFSFSWRMREAGSITVASRPTDPAGATQPPAAARNAIHTVAVTVTA